MNRWGAGDGYRKRGVNNRVGGGVAPAVLPHHRTYGSVSGGSCVALKPAHKGEQRQEAKVLKVFHGKSLIHVCGPAVPPRAMSVCGRPPGSFFIQSPFHQILCASEVSFPLSPDDGPQLVPQPFIKHLEWPLHFGQSKIGGKAPQLRREGGYGILEATATTPAANFLDSAA